MSADGVALIAGRTATHERSFIFLPLSRCADVPRLMSRQPATCAMSSDPVGPARAAVSGSKPFVEGFADLPHARGIEAAEPRFLRSTQ